MTEETKNFMEHLNELRSAVETIEKMEEPNIDALVPIIETGTKSYQACFERINTVEKLLSKFIED